MANYDKKTNNGCEEQAHKSADSVVRMKGAYRRVSRETNCLELSNICSSQLTVMQVTLKGLGAPHCEYHIIFRLFCALLFGLLTIEKSRLDRKRSEKDSHPSTTYSGKGT